MSRCKAKMIKNKKHKAGKWTQIEGERVQTKFSGDMQINKNTKI